MSRSLEARARRAPGRARAIQHQATVADAAGRQLVRLPDGRTARLLRVPAQSSHISPGAKARVILQSGAVLSVPLADVTVIYEEPT